MKISLDPLHSGDTTRIIIDPITPVKVRRVKDQGDISRDNLFFLQKVISRQHAIIYEEDNKIYVKDTKSSGGTWINGIRLSNAGVESSPTLLNKDDVLQFGEDTQHDGDVLQAVKFKVDIDQLPNGSYKSLDNLSPEGNIKLVTPIPNVDLTLRRAAQESSASGFLERNQSWIDPITLVKKSLLDPNTIISQSGSSDTHQNLPELPVLPNHIQEELNLLWNSLDKLSADFRDAEILLQKS